ncbi:histidinol-phosphate transaminase [Bacillaceae bacterium Marseille-Q3522]|nr:histidinol-phosphate transaminase [Bacillaceae bacterium Marseille-Q3522]
MQWKKQLLDLVPYQPGKSIESVKKEYRLKEIVKLASNENPSGCSAKVALALRENTHLFQTYPDGYATELRLALADLLHVDQKQLIFGNGSDNIIQMISRSLLKPGKNTVMAFPTFTQYKHNAIIEGAEIREIPLVNGEHDLPKMLSAIDQDTTVVWLCSPNNPTGKYINNETLKAFLDAVPAETLVVLDEAYYEYVTATDYYDAIQLLQDYKNLIVLRTFSKIYGLASLRVGYGISNEAIIRALEPVREPFNVNALAIKLAKTALEDQQFVATCKKQNREGLEQFYQFCQKHHLHYFPSQANFILIDFERDGDEVFQYLMERGYIVRSGRALGFSTMVRITVGSKKQNDGVMKVMEQYIQDTFYCKQS